MVVLRLAGFGGALLASANILTFAANGRTRRERPTKTVKLLGSTLYTTNIQPLGGERFFRMSQS